MNSSLYLFPLLGTRLGMRYLNGSLHLFHQLGIRYLNSSLYSFPRLGIRGKGGKVGLGLGLGLLNSTDPWESLELKHKSRGGNTSLGAGVSLYCAVGRVTGCISGVSPNWFGSYLRPWVA